MSGMNGPTAPEMLQPRIGSTSMFGSSEAEFGISRNPAIVNSRAPTSRSSHRRMERPHSAIMRRPARLTPPRFVAPEPLRLWAHGGIHILLMQML